MSIEIDYSSGAFESNSTMSIGTVTQAQAGYDIANASYDSKSFSVATQETVPFDLDFKPDGTSFVIVGQTNDTAYQYNCSVAWDISTASYASKSLSLSSQMTSPRGILFNNDGTTMYVQGADTDTIFVYSLSVAYDISTGSYSNVSLDLTPAASNFVGGQFSIPSGGAQDGTKLYVGCYNTDRIYSWTLGTAWDLSTASLDSTNFNVLSYDGVHAGINVNSDGTKWWISARQTDKIIQFSMSTPYDISTSSKDTAELSWAGQTTDGYGFRFKDDGTKLYLMGTNDDTIYQYSIGSYVQNIDLSTGNYFKYTPTSNTTFTFGNAPASGSVAGFALEITGANGAAAWDIANASYDNKSFSVSSQASSPTGVQITPDGTKVFVNNYPDGKIHEYDLSTAFDISTATYSNNFIAVSSPGIRRNLKFNNDGTVIFYLSASAVKKIPLNTAYTLSDGTGTQTQYSFSSGGLHDLFFKSDGTSLYLARHGDTTVYQFNLSAPFDLSTISSFAHTAADASFSVSSQDGTLRGLAFSSDGLRMIIVGDSNNTVYQYTLSTAWDISTASYDSISFSVNSETSKPEGVGFTSDGTKMYIIGPDNDTIYQYSTTGSPVQTTITYPASAKFSEGVAPSSPEIGQKDILSFYTDDGGTTYQGSNIASDIKDYVEPPVIGGHRYTTAGTYTWTCPTGVTSVCVVCVGAGGSGGAYGGSGGSLAYKNNITVVPGQSYTIVAGATNSVTGAVAPYTEAAEDSSALGTTATGGEGGYSGTSSSQYKSIGSNYDGGGRGGLASSDFYGAIPEGGNAYREGAGGGAGGYNGDGGTAGQGPASGTSGSGGAGGGGSVGSSGGTGGGGVGLFGQGSNGAAATANQSTTGGAGGSGGATGGNTYGGQFGAGSAAMGSTTPTAAQTGAVRIIWGDGRSFPSTNTSLAASSGNESEN